MAALIGAFNRNASGGSICTSRSPRDVRLPATNRSLTFCAWKRIAARGNEASWHSPSSTATIWVPIMRLVSGECAVSTNAPVASGDTAWEPAAATGRLPSENETSIWLETVAGIETLQDNVDAWKGWIVGGLAVKELRTSLLSSFRSSM